MTEYFVVTELPKGSEWAEGDAVMLRREPDKGLDGHAVVVTTARGEHVGYLWREDAEELSPRVENDAYEAWIDRVLSGAPDQPYCGVVIEVRFGDER